MKDETLLLKELALQRDIISLGVCVSIYQTSSGVQFKNMPASDFINFLNLKLSKELVNPLPREKQRICYMVYAVSCTINQQTILNIGLKATWIYAISLRNIIRNITKIFLAHRLPKRTKNIVST